MASRVLKGRRPRRAWAQLIAENRRLRRRVAALSTGPEAHTGRLDDLALQNEQLAASTRLAALVAHELNTPLQAIENYLFLVGDDPEQPGALSSIRREVGRVGAVVQRLRTFQEIGAAPRDALALGGVVESVLLLTESRLRRQRVRVACQLAPGLPPIRGRDGDLTLLLLNLVLRAADRMPEGGLLTLRARVDPQAPQVTLEVADTGPSPGDEGAEFGPFYTTDAMAPAMRLQICRRLLDGHGGRLSLGHEFGGGHKVIVELPLAASSS